jgi:hypothetical protein
MVTITLMSKSPNFYFYLFTFLGLGDRNFGYLATLPPPPNSKTHDVMMFLQRAVICEVPRMWMTQGAPIWTGWGVEMERSQRTVR